MSGTENDMKYLNALIILAVVMNCVLPMAGQTIVPTLWYEGRAGALSLTFDDGLASHWSVAAPAMSSRNLRGTFFVITGSVDWEGARAAALAGHEIASHSTTDQKLVTPAPRPHQLVAGAEQRLLDSIAAIETQIGSVIAGYRCYSFAYPYGITSLESDDTNLPDLVSQHFVASRTAGGNVDHNHWSSLQWAYRWNAGWRFGHNYAERNDLAFHWISRSLDLAGTAAEATTVANHLDDWAIANNRWAVYLYHSEGGADNFDLHLDAIESRKDQLWIAPFGDVARYIKQREAVQTEVLSNSGNTIVIAVTDGLDNAIYHLPLTLSFELPSGWDSVSATQGGEPIAAWIDGATLYFNAVPDAGEVTLHGPADGPEPVAPGDLALVLGEGVLTITFTSVEGLTYTLESNSDLGAIWTPVADVEPLAGDGDAQVFTMQPLPALPVFFRVRVE